MTSTISHLITWTLIHSLWIGAAMLILTRIVSLVNVKSKTRSIVRMGALLIFILTNLCVFAYKLHTKADAGILQIAYHEPFIGTELNVGIEAAEQWISMNSMLINTAWLIGMLLSLASYYMGFWRLHKIRLSSHVCEDNCIIRLINDIKRKLKIKYHVEVRISSFINSPITVRWLKPIIYVPIGFATGFSEQEIESILFHEMAHIKRKDYLVNLILAALKTLFFFNPFVLIIIKDLRSDMEFACDDLVIESNSKMVYIHALLKLQELRFSNTLGLAARQNNSEFKKRINKMMNTKMDNSNGQQRLMPGLMVGLFLIMAIMSSAFMNSEELHNEVKISIEEEFPQAQDTIRASTYTELKQKLSEVSKEDLSTTVLMMNGKEVKLVIKAMDGALAKADEMMKEIKTELVNDGILNENQPRLKLMFQYSDLLNGKEVLGDKYPKYKKIFNTYFPVYDSYATTRIFKLD